MKRRKLWIATAVIISGLYGCGGGGGGGSGGGTTADTNGAPTAKAGVDALVDRNSLVFLYGTASTDPDNDVLSYTWTQVSGEDVGPIASSSAPSFTAPATVGTLEFELVVSDGTLDSVADRVRINVLEKTTNALFVDGDSGSDSGDGSMASPYATISHALAQAAAGAGEDIYIKSAATPYDETAAPLSLTPTTSLYGGYGAGWVRDAAANRTQILGNATAVSMAVNSEEAWVSGLQISVADGSTSLYGIRSPGDGANGVPVNVLNNTITIGNTTAGSVIGVEVVKASNAAVRNNTISVGSGAAGVNGANASTVVIAGTDGGRGVDGGLGGTTFLFKTYSQGGNGGKGALNVNDTALPGSDGTVLVGSTLVPVALGGAYAVTSGAGGPGENGPDGANGAHATVAGGGTGAVNTTTKLWMTANGADGAAGTWGGGGGGGGGGAADLSGPGGHGGGGGSGGLAGGPGYGGKGGGASIGIYLAAVTSAEVDSNVVTTANGGAGGSGGNRATAGGAGGLGGKGEVTIAGDGGKGGNGGAGGVGGDGAGGGGGPSFGIFVGPDMAPVITNNTITTGNGGNGGGVRDGTGGGGGWSVAIYDAATADGAVPVVSNNSVTLGAAGAAGVATGTGLDGTAGIASDINWTIPKVPAAPSGLSLTLAKTGAVIATWSDNSDNELRFELEVLSNDTVLGSVELAANTTTYSYAPPDPAPSSVTVRVRAANSTGASSWVSKVYIFL